MHAQKSVIIENDFLSRWEVVARWIISDASNMWNACLSEISYAYKKSEWRYRS